MADGDANGGYVKCFPEIHFETTDIPDCEQEASYHPSVEHTSALGYFENLIGIRSEIGKVLDHIKNHHIQLPPQQSNDGCKQEERKKILEVQMTTPGEIEHHHTSGQQPQENHNKIGWEFEIAKEVNCRMHQTVFENPVTSER